MSVYKLQGPLSLRDPGESMDILYCGKECVAEWAEENLEGKQINLRYWITDKPCTFEQAQQDALETAFGKVESEYGARYSEVTGYLWTDEEFRVGGHDMIDQLKTCVGKYLLLEATIV